MASFKKIDPANMVETSNLVQVFNISPSSTEKKIYDFFQYCGDIVEYEIVPVEDGFEALLLFDKASSVDTAVLLNNSRIDDRNIIVKKYDDAVKEAAEKAADAPAEKQELGPNSKKLANLIAEGILQAEQFSSKIDNKLRVTEKFQQLVEESKKLKDTVDTKFGITEKTTMATNAINTKIEEFKNNEKVTAAKNATQPRVDAAINVAQPAFNNIVNSAPVKKIQDIFAQVKGKVNDVTQETLKIKEEKSAKLNTGVPESQAASATEGVAVAAESKATTETTTVNATAEN